ncbi:MAG: hypothetical protein ACR2PQ_04665, partial [Myxococcota bacterium]
LLRRGALFGAALLLAALLGGGVTHAMGDWQEVESEPGDVTGYVLSRRPAAREGTWTYRLVTRVGGPPERVARASLLVLTDDRYVPEGQRRTTLVEREGEVINHLLIDLPLAADRDVTNRVVIDGASPDGVHRLRWNALRGVGPDPQPDVVRIPWLRGSFAFDRAGGDTTEVVYEMEVDLGGRLPAALVRSFLPSQMKAQIHVLREALAELRAVENSTREANQS